MTEELTTTVYDESDADTAHIQDKTVAVLGYGSQGHAQAQNLADSGVDVVVGLREGSSSRAEAEADGLTVATPDVAVSDADIAVMLVPDTVQPAVYEAVADGLEAGDTLQFAHGFNIHYGQI
ncbi:MAG: NAD(P)-dependent oxidoreductase, partial [Haloarculaceae archaeon]